MSSKASGKLRIFHVATEYIVASTADEAMKFYAAMVGESWLEGDEEAEEVPHEHWATMKIVDIDEPGHPEHTFQQAFDDMLTWENQEYPKVIATSEY